MAHVTVEIGGRQATVNGGKWTSDDPALFMMLNDDAELTSLPTADPFPDHTLALNAIKSYGGRIVEVVPPVRVPGRIY